MADFLSIGYTAIVYFVSAALLLYIISKALKFPKTDVLTAVKAAFMYEASIFCLGAIAGLLLFPLASSIDITLLSLIISVLFIPVHIMVLAASVQNSYNVSWKKAALTAVLIAVLGLALGIIIVLAAIILGGING